MPSGRLGVERKVFISHTKKIFMINFRFAFLDLTAGPFEWGPIIGGEGVRSFDSKPKVPIKADWRDTSIPLDEEESPSLAADMERYRSELAMLEAYKNTHCNTPLE